MAGGFYAHRRVDLNDQFGHLRGRRKQRRRGEALHGFLEQTDIELVRVSAGRILEEEHAMAGALDDFRTDLNVATLGSRFERTDLPLDELANLRAVVRQLEISAQVVAQRQDLGE